eukprot:g19715.t1
MMDIFTGSFAVVCNVVGMFGTWIHFTAKEDENETCQQVTSVGLWLSVCRQVYCEGGGVGYKCYHSPIEDLPDEWRVTQAFMTLALIFSVIALTASCCLVDNEAPAAHRAMMKKLTGCLWTVTMIWGIIAFSVWTDFNGITNQTGIWDSFTRLYGGGYMFCILGWIFAFFAAFVDFTGFCDFDDKLYDTV